MIWLAAIPSLGTGQESLKISIICKSGLYRNLVCITYYNILVRNVSCRQSAVGSNLDLSRRGIGPDSAVPPIGVFESQVIRKCFVVWLDFVERNFIRLSNGGRAMPDDKELRSIRQSQLGEKDVVAGANPKRSEVEETYREE